MFEGWGAAAAAAAVVGGVGSSQASSKAAGAQKKSSKNAVEAENYRFDQMNALLKPYVDAGNKSMTAQGDLAGVNGPDAQRAAIATIEGSPEFADMTKQGETSILQNAS